MKGRIGKLLKVLVPSMLAIVVAVIGGLAVYWVQHTIESKEHQQTQVAAEKETQRAQAAVHADAVRVTYYRISGLALRFITQGCLPPEWQQLFGQSPSIVKNAVLKEASNFLDKYGTYIYGNSISGDFQNETLPEVIDLDELRRAVNCVTPDNSVKWTAYLSGSGHYTIFIPDISAINTVFNTLEWPPNYQLGSPDFGSFDNTYPNLPLRPIWRYLSSADLDGYDKRYRQYEDQLVSHSVAGHDVRPVGVSQLEDSKMVDSIRYITAGGVPPGFMAVVGEPGTHGGWQFSSAVRDLVLVVAVYENVSNVPIKVGDFSYREIAVNSLRTEEATSTLLNTRVDRQHRLYPIGQLAPGEKILVAVKLQLIFPEQEIEKAVSEHRDAASRLAQDTGGSDAIVSYDGIFKKRVAAFKEPVQANLIRRFDFGPAWRVTAMIVNGTRVPLRDFDAENFLLYAGSEKGSCPRVLTSDSVSGTQRYQGEILINAIGKSRETQDEIQLHGFDGVVDIKEEDAEVTVIDSAYLRLKNKNTGLEEIMTFDSASLTFDDEKVIVLRGGQALRGDFRSQGRRWADYDASLVMTGYYLPFELGQTQQSKRE